MVFDKTGTLTEEQPHVGKIHCYGIEENELLSYAAAAEYKQKHPIALAILAEVKQRNLNVIPITQAKYEVGYGIKVQITIILTFINMLQLM
ncbi:MAG: HAD family hydrolase [Thiomargarita sp.]|nr:HAD family hydrolase [Thiomargarita sp.]